MTEDARGNRLERSDQPIAVGTADADILAEAPSDFRRDRPARETAYLVLRSPSCSMPLEQGRRNQGTGLSSRSGSTFANALAIEVFADCLLHDRRCALVAFERQPLHFFDQSRIHIDEKLPPAGERRPRSLLIPRHRKELYPSAIPTSPRACRAGRQTDVSSASSTMPAARFQKNTSTLLKDGRLGAGLVDRGPLER